MRHISRVPKIELKNVEKVARGDCFLSGDTLSYYYNVFVVIVVAARRRKC